MLLSMIFILITNDEVILSKERLLAQVCRLVVLREKVILAFYMD